MLSKYWDIAWFHSKLPFCLGCVYEDLLFGDVDLSAKV
jgi:hypothetical protein